MSRIHAQDTQRSDGAPPPPPGAAVPDRHLFERLADGDDAALGELARRYSLTLYAVAYEILFDSEAADRVVARAFRELKRDAVAGVAGLFPVRWWLTELTRSYALRLHHGSSAADLGPTAV